MTIKRKIFLIVLGISLVSLISFCAAAFWGLFSIQAQVRQLSAELGDFAAENSSHFLEIEILERLTASARDQSLIINERLLSIAKDAQYFSNFAAEIYKHGSDLPPIPIPYSSTANRGKLTMQLSSANGQADYPRIRREAEMLGNISAAFESNKDDMDSLTVSLFLGTESGFSISYDPFSHNDNQIFDPRERVWYIGAKNAGNTFWTAPYIGIDSGELVITCSYPFYDAYGVFTGVIGIDVLIDDLNSEIININTSEGGFAVIIDADDNLISSSISQIPESLLGDIKREISPGASGFKRVISEGSLNEPERRSFQRNDLFLVYSPIETTGWTLAILEPASVITDIINKNNEAIDAVTQETREHVSEIIRFIILVFSGIFIIVVTGIAVFSDKMSTKIALPIDVLEAELNVAKNIQANMLPSIFPPFPNRKEFDIYATMQPAKEVGGDFYDFFMINEDKIAVVIADVSGKGVPAALFMVIAKTLLKNNAQSGKSPQDVFYAVNNLLCENNDACMFVTVFMGFLEISTGKFTYVNAGHNPPLLRREGKDYEMLSVEPSFVIAAMENKQYKQNEIILNKGDSLFLYTDGVTEAFNVKEEQFTEERLLESAKRYLNEDLKDFLHGIKNEIDNFANGAEQADDITMLILDYRGSFNPMKEMVIKAEIENLDSVLDFIGAEMEEKHICSELQNNFKMAADEIFVNICNYAYEDSAGSAAVRVEINEKEIIIEFEDSGKQINPLKKEDPDLSIPASQRKIGGLGIFLVKKLMDTAEYRYENGKNIITIKKRYGNDS